MSQTREFRGTKTNVLNINGEIHGIYHNTTVCKLIQGGKVVLNSGGYMTNTTRLRMNQFSNQFCNGRFKVYQKDFDWYVVVNGTTINYVDGVTV